MTNKKSTKRSLLLSVLSLVLCLSMLVGTTFAWFTDSVTSGKNRIVAGNLDVELDYYTNGKWETVQDATDLFSDELWEPGHTEVVYLKVTNAGSLAMKYQLGVKVAAETGSINVNKEAFKLSDYIRFGVEGDKQPSYASRDEAVKAVADNSLQLNKGYSQVGTLKSGEVAHLALVVYMPTTVGNEANYLKGAPVPTIDLGVDLVATQATYEADDFGNLYDATATYPVVSIPVAIPDNATAPETIKTKDITVEVPAAVLNALPNTVESFRIAHSEPRIDTANNTVTFDSVDLVDQNGTPVDLENIAGSVAVKLDVSAHFAEGDIVAIYHDGELMAQVAVDADGMVSYDAEHFCEVTIVKKGVPVSTIDELNAALKAGENVVLTADIELTSTLMANKDVVIDLNGNTITASFSGNLFQSQSNAAPSMTITSSAAGAEINVSGGATSVLLGYGSTVINNVTINVTGCDNTSPNPFNVYGDLTLGEGTVVNVDYLGRAFISNNGKVAIVIDGAQINVDTFKTNGKMITLNKATTLEIKNTGIKIDNYVLSQFGGEGLVDKVEGVTIEGCTFDVTDSNGAECTFVADAALGRYDLVQK